MPSAIHGGSLLGTGTTDNQFTFTSSQTSPKQQAEEIDCGDDIIPLVHLHKVTESRAAGSYPVTGLNTRPRDANANMQG